MTRFALGGKCGRPGTPPTGAPARTASRPSRVPSAIAPRFSPDRARNVRRLWCCADWSASKAGLLLRDRLVQVQDHAGDGCVGGQLDRVEGLVHRAVAVPDELLRGRGVGGE